jgi:large subunit ribosomal protein L18
MSDKKQARLRRARRTRAKIRELGSHRLCVFRTPRHIYAQVIVAGDSGDSVLASASTLDASLRASGKTGSVDAAGSVGRLVAERALQLGVTQVAFDRSGFKYHGRVKALADAARAAGLSF